MQRLFATVLPAPKNQNLNQNNDAPWLFVTGAKFFSAFAGLVAILLGIIEVILSPLSMECLFAGAILTGEGLAMVLIEAPCLCMFLDFAFLPSKFFEGKSFWIKAGMYLCFSGIPVFFCQSVSLLLSCLLIFFSSASYLVLGLGKKATAEEMRAKIINESPTSILVANEVMASNTAPAASPFYKNDNNPTSTSQTTTNKNDLLVY